MKVIVFTNAKGGTAKTTTSVNTAHCLARLGFKTLFVDMDPQGCATGWLQMQKTGEGDLCFLDFLLRDDGVSWEDIVKPTPFENLSIIPGTDRYYYGDIHLDKFYRDSPTAPDVEPELLLRHRLSKVVAPWDYCIVDTSPHMGLITRCCLVSSDFLAVPVCMRPQEIAKLEDFVGILRDLHQQFDERMGYLAGVLPCRVDLRMRVSRDGLAVTTQFFQSDNMFRTHIRECVKVSECVSSKVSVFEYAPYSTGSQDFANFVKELLERIGDPVTPAKWEELQKTITPPVKKTPAVSFLSRKITRPSLGSPKEKTARIRKSTASVRPDTSSSERVPVSNTEPETSAQSLKP